MHRRRITTSSRKPRVVHKSTGGMLHQIPAPVDLVGNPPDLTFNTVALPASPGAERHPLQSEGVDFRWG